MKCILVINPKPKKIIIIHQNIKIILHGEINSGLRYWRCITILHMFSKNYSMSRNYKIYIIDLMVKKYHKLLNRILIIKSLCRRKEKKILLS